ncbi:unnamed protein product [Rhizoctonia solani]|uniref:Uncharacterized protein n=1 Tax=Rhizoctonia solani TaxID=456999 RepID=A0A8H3DGX1_9AGAM|nr:unnamed protein product [Rhizoctonia solani]
MKYASVIIPLVLVGVLFLLGCIWVATRKDKDEGDEESVPELASPTPKKPALGMPKPDLAMPVRAHIRPTPHTITPPHTGHSSSCNSLDHEPPRYER